MQKELVDLIFHLINRFRNGIGLDTLADLERAKQEKNKETRQKRKKEILQKQKK